MTLKDKQMAELHDKKSNNLLFNPGIIGLDNIVLSGQVNLFAGNQLLSQPDGLFFDSCGNAWLMEYKLSKGRRGGAVEQLNNSETYLKAVLGVHPNKIFVYGSLYKHEVIP